MKLKVIKITRNVKFFKWLESLIFRSKQIKKSIAFNGPYKKRIKLPFKMRCILFFGDLISKKYEQYIEFINDPAIYDYSEFLAELERVNSSRYSPGIDKIGYINLKEGSWNKGFFVDYQLKQQAKEEAIQEFKNHQQYPFSFGQSKDPIDFKIHLIESGEIHLTDEENQLSNEEKEKIIREKIALEIKKWKGNVDGK